MMLPIEYAFWEPPLAFLIGVAIGFVIVAVLFALMPKS